MIVIKAFPRVHISLLDLGDVTPRRYGGAGFSIDGNGLEVSAKSSKQTLIAGLDLLDQPARIEAEKVLSAFRSLQKDCPELHLGIRRAPPQHAGFGTKTALLLSVLAAANRAAGAGLSAPEIQRLSGRGGASGVGIHLFFVGGFLCDLGHPNPEDAPFAPSSAVNPARVPPLACRFDTPSTWRFLLMLPQGKRLAGKEETQFFQKATPLPRIEVLEAIAAMYHGVVPAVLNADIATLGSSLKILHSIGFKRRELDAQSEAVRRTYYRLSLTPGLAAGLSSLGPLIYAAVDARDSHATEAASRICAEEGGAFLGVFSGRNTGHEIAYE